MVEYEIHDSVIQEYVGQQQHAGRDRAGMIWEPAYVDNVAKVTPVEPSLLPKMRKTRRVIGLDDFTDRVETTLVFLGFLRSCEDSFRDPKRLEAMGRPRQLPRVPRKRSASRVFGRGMAVAYRIRLSAPQARGLIEKRPTRRWWAQILAILVFLDVDKADIDLGPLRRG